MANPFSLLTANRGGPVSGDNEFKNNSDIWEVSGRFRTNGTATPVVIAGRGWTVDEGGTGLWTVTIGEVGLYFSDLICCVHSNQETDGDDEEAGVDPVAANSYVAYRGHTLGDLTTRATLLFQGYADVLGTKTESALATVDIDVHFIAKFQLSGYRSP
jgi:hypothetical protein